MLEQSINIGKVVCNLKKALSLLLALTIFVSMTTTVFADRGSAPRRETRTKRILIDYDGPY